MNIDCTFGRFKIIKTVSRKDELLVLSKWDSLVKIFENSRIFMVNPKDAIFGVYLGQKECFETVQRLIKEIDYKDWDNLELSSDSYLEKK